MKKYLFFIQKVFGNARKNENLCKHQMLKIISYWFVLWVSCEFYKENLGIYLAHAFDLFSFFEYCSSSNILTTIIPCSSSSKLLNKSKHHSNPLATIFYPNLNHNQQDTKRKNSKHLIRKRKEKLFVSINYYLSNYL